jgi:hypothetical protein
MRRILAAGVLLTVRDDDEDNLLGATLFSVFGYFYVKNKGEGGIVAHLMLTKMQDEPKEPE